MKSGATEIETICQGVLEVQVQVIVLILRKMHSDVSFCLLEEDHLRPFSQQEFGETALIKQPPRAFLQKAQTQI